jgi:hypothetical protein
MADAVSRKIGAKIQVSKAIRTIRAGSNMMSPRFRLLAFLGATATAAQLAAWAQRSHGAIEAADHPQAAITSRPTMLADTGNTSSRSNNANKLHAAAQPDKRPTATYDGPTVLDPSNYYGGAAMGYAAAKAAPQVMNHLFCYCGCDATEHHQHLIDCFTSTHGVDCHICQEEAILAYRLFKDGSALADIQKQIDEKYSAEYPFQEDTGNLKQYKTERLYKPAAKSRAAEAEPANAVSTSNSTAAGNGGKAVGVPKVKPGFQVGNCCHDDK